MWSVLSKGRNTLVIFWKVFPEQLLTRFAWDTGEAVWTVVNTLYELTLWTWFTHSVRSFRAHVFHSLSCYIHMKESPLFQVSHFKCIKAHWHYNSTVSTSWWELEVSDYCSSFILSRCHVVTFGLIFFLVELFNHIFMHKTVLFITVQNNVVIRELFNVWEGVY